MRVAFASGSGTHIDQHYGKTRRFYVWEIGPEAAACVGHIDAPPTDEARGLEESLAARADSVADCHILYTLQIGGPAAAKLVRRNVHPMKAAGVTPISDMVARLQEVLRNNPPPWLRKLAVRP
jgi:nitrogen fixation protein NifX